MSKKRNIGILSSHFSWDGGVDFLVFLSKGISADTNNNIYLLVNYRYINFIKYSILKFPSIIKSPKQFFLKKEWLMYENKITEAFEKNNIDFQKIYFGHFEYSLRKLVRSNDLCVVLPSMRPFSNKLNWIGYIPDLQHKYFPDWFSEKEKSRRDSFYHGMLESGNKVIVNSREVKKDLIRIYGCKGENIISLPFIPLMTGKLPIKSNEILGKYNIRKKFFMISNQFWKHKNHVVAFQGYLEFCKKTETPIDLVCTGNTKDGRFPNYFSELVEYINKSEYRDNIKILGFIPKEDQIALLMHCHALIQPTLFEGGPGGGAVYNSLALGKISVVSDIPINKEIDSELVYFFQKGNPSNLAEVLLKVSLMPDVALDVQKINDYNVHKLKMEMDKLLTY